MRHKEGVWGIGELHTPTGPRIEPRSAEHGIEVRLERSDVPSTLLPYRTRRALHRPHRRWDMRTPARASRSAGCHQLASNAVGGVKSRDP